MSTIAPTAQKSWVVALLLCFFLGGLGVHRFYVGKVGTGILQIVTVGGFFGIWVHSERGGPPLYDGKSSGFAGGKADFFTLH